MKNEFLGFYEPTKEEIDKAWDNGSFIFDANALLNLYRYTESTREDFLKALSYLEKKLFMPFQVGFEFHSNRIRVIKGLKDLFESIPKDLDKSLKDGGAIDSIFNIAKRHPSIDIEAFRKLKENYYKDIQQELKKQKASHPDFLKEDTILDRITQFYNGKIGKPYSEEQLEKVFNEGRDRYKKNIPPGYKDFDAKKSQGDQRVFGDLIIWKQIIDFAKENKTPVVLITDDRKEDWWTIENGQTIRPREELIKEFFDQTGIRILIYTADNFLNYAKSRGIILDLNDESIEEIQEVRLNDESLNFLNNISHEYRSKTRETFFKNYLKNLAMLEGANFRNFSKDQLKIRKTPDLKKLIEDLNKAGMNGENWDFLRTNDFYNDQAEAYYKALQDEEADAYYKALQEDEADAYYKALQEDEDIDKLKDSKGNSNSKENSQEKENKSKTHPKKGK